MFSRRLPELDHLQLVLVVSQRTGGGRRDDARDVLLAIDRELGGLLTKSVLKTNGNLIETIGNHLRTSNFGPETGSRWPREGFRRGST